VGSANKKCFLAAATVSNQLEGNEIHSIGLADLQMILRVVSCFFFQDLNLNYNLFYIVLKNSPEVSELLCQRLTDINNI